MKRSVLIASRLFTFALNNRRFKPAMLTLTYRDVDGFQPRHVSELVKRIRQWLERRGHRMHYVWVAELQARGALHYHMLIWLPRGLTLPKPDKQGWWPHGSTRIEWARKPIGYLTKYVSKSMPGMAFPKGVRLHGCGGFDELSRDIKRWFNLPGWLKAMADVNRRFKRITGVGLIDRETGERMVSPWVVMLRAGRVFARKLFDYPDALPDVGGPWSAWEPAA